MNKLEDKQLDKVSGGRACKFSTLEKGSSYRIHWKRNGEEGTFNGKVKSKFAIAADCTYTFENIECLSGVQPAEQYSTADIVTATKL